MKIKDAILDVHGKILGKKNVTAEACAEKCLSDENCLSFEIAKKGGECYLSNKTAASSKKLKTDKSRNYYQRMKRNYFLYLVFGILFSCFFWIYLFIYTSWYIGNHFSKDINRFTYKDRHRHVPE